MADPKRLTTQDSIIANAPTSVPHNNTVYLYDRNDNLVASVPPSGVIAPVTITAVKVRWAIGPAARTFVFKEDLHVDVGQSIAFSLAAGPNTLATVSIQGQDSQTYQLTRLPMDDLSAERSEILMKTMQDDYIIKLLHFAQAHALQGSTREEFNRAFAKSGITDGADVSKLSKDEFDVVNNANANVHLQGSATVDSDQDLYDASSMLATAVNTRVAALNKAAHPADYDVSNPDDQIQMVNDSANGLINFYNSQAMAPFLVTKSLATSSIIKQYATATIQLDAIVDLFSSLALPESVLTEMVGAVKAFTESTAQLAVSGSKKNIKNAKLVNFFSIQPPTGLPDLAHVPVMRMFYMLFNEETIEWSTSCSKGQYYRLDISLFTFDCEVNRKVVMLTYDKNLEMILKLADTTFGDLGPSGQTPTVDPSKTKTDDPSPIGPPPT